MTERITDYIPTTLCASAFPPKLFIGRSISKYLTIHVDPDMPDNVMEIRDESGRVLTKIINLAV